LKNKYLIYIVLVLAVVAVFSSRSNSATFYDEDSDQTIVSVYDPETENVSSLDLEEYVIGVVAAEMPASFHEEALKAQAIAARTYALYKMKHVTKDYDVIADVSNQAYINEDKMKEKWKDEFSIYYKKIKEAVLDTKDVVMTYDGEVIISYYFAMSNGNTEDVSSVFGENKDYLKSVDSSWDKSVNNYEVINTFLKKDFCNKLGIDGDIVVNTIKRTNTGRVETIVINGKSFKGTSFRQLLGLRSTDFDIYIKDNVKITTRGYGHGVGMSQYGANAMARLGNTYEEILKYYYQNVSLEKVNV